MWEWGWIHVWETVPSNKLVRTRVNDARAKGPNSCKPGGNVENHPFTLTPKQRKSILFSWHFQSRTREAFEAKIKGETICPKEGRNSANVPYPVYPLKRFDHDKLTETSLLSSRMPFDRFRLVSRFEIGLESRPTEGAWITGSNKQLYKTFYQRFLLTWSWAVLCCLQNERLCKPCFQMHYFLIVIETYPLI